MKLEAGDFPNCLLTTYHLYACHVSNFPMLSSSLFFLSLRFIYAYICRFSSSLILPSASCSSPPSLLLLCLFPSPLLPIAFFSSRLSFSVFLQCYIFCLYLFFTSSCFISSSSASYYYPPFIHLLILLYFCSPPSLAPPHL